MEKEKNSFNPWPYGIAAAIFGVFGLCVWTVKETESHPVQMDSFYFEDYHHVDHDYDKIYKDQKLFESRYQVSVLNKSFLMGQAQPIKIKVTPKVSDREVNDLNISILVTRPNTNEYNQKPAMHAKGKGLFESDPISVKLPGRWQVMSKITIDGVTGFFKNEVNATK